MVQLVSDYSDYTQKIPKLIKEAHYKAGYYLERLKMPRPAFYRKLRNNTFTIEDTLAKIETIKNSLVSLQ